MFSNKHRQRTSERKPKQRKRRLGTGKRRPLILEQLEIRALLTSGFPHVHIAGTAGPDPLVLDTDPGDSAMLRVWSTSGSMATVSFPKVGLVSLTIDGGGGTDSITVATDVLLDGGAVLFEAESITIGAGTTISGAGQVTLLALPPEAIAVLSAVASIVAFSIASSVRSPDATVTSALSI